MDADDQSNRRGLRRRLSIGLVCFLLALAPFTLLVALDLLFTKPHNFAIESASVNLAATSPTANATIDFTFEPKVSKVSFTNAVCELDSGEIFIDIEAVPTDSSIQRYHLYANVDEEDLQHHGDLAWDVATGQKGPSLQGCSIHVKIWIGYFIPIQYTYSIDDFGSFMDSDLVEVNTEGDQKKKGDEEDGSEEKEEDEKGGENEENNVNTGVFTAKVSRDELLVTYKPSLAIPEAVPVQVVLPAFVLSAGTGTSRTSLLHFEGANIQDLSNAEALTLAIGCGGECAWYNPLVDLALEGGGTVEVTVDADQSFVEYILGRHHEIKISKKKKEFSSGRRMEEMCSAVCIDISTDGAYADLCLAFQISEGVMIEGEFQAFGSEGKAAGDVKWTELEDGDGINIQLHSKVSVNDDSKMDLSGVSTILFVADEVQFSSALENSVGNWPIESRLESSITLNDGGFSVKIGEFYAKWDGDDAANVTSAFSIDFTEKTLNGFFSNTASAWPVQSSTSASATWGDGVFKANIDEARLVWRDKVLLETVGNFVLDFDEATVLLVATDPSYQCRLNGNLVDNALDFFISLDIEGGVTIMSVNSGFLRILERPEGFQIGASSTVSLDSEEEFEVSVDFVFEYENLDVSVSIANIAGRWPMEFNLSGRMLEGGDTFQVLLDQLSLVFQDTVILNTIVNFMVDLSNDFDFTLTVKDPSFMIDAGAQLERHGTILDQPEYTDSTKGFFVAKIENDLILDFSFGGIIAWSNVDDSFRVTGSAKEEAYAASLETVLDVRPDYDNLLGIDRVDTKLEQFVFVVNQRTYADAVGSVKLGFDSQSVQIVLENSARTTLKATTAVTWAFQDESTSILELNFAQVVLEVGGRSFIDATGSISLGESSDTRSSGEIEWKTVGEAARVQSSAAIEYLLLRPTGTGGSFGLQARLADGRLAFDGKELIDWKMGVVVRDSEESLTGELSVVSDNQDAFIQVNGLVEFKVDDSLTARIAPLSLVVDSSVLTNFTTDLVITPNVDKASVLVSFRTEDANNGVEMSLERMELNWPRDIVTMTMDGLFLALPGRSPVLDGELGFELDFDGELFQLHIENNSTWLHVDTDLAFDFDAFTTGGAKNDTHISCILP